MERFMIIHNTQCIVAGKNNKITTLTNPKITVTISQLEILSEVAKGKTYPEIAKKTGMNQGHIGNVVSKLMSENCCNRNELVSRGVQAGLLHPHPLEDISS